MSFSFGSQSLLTWRVYFARTSDIHSLMPISGYFSRKLFSSSRRSLPVDAKRGCLVLSRSSSCFISRMNRFESSKSFWSIPSLSLLQKPEVFFAGLQARILDFRSTERDFTLLLLRTDMTVLGLRGYYARRDWLLLRDLSSSLLLAS